MYVSNKRSWFNIFYVIFIAIFVLRFSILSITNGLDASWIYALNLKTGIFTYGPLGILFFPINMGNHVFFSFAYWLIITISACIIFPRVISHAPSKNIFLSFMLLYLGAYFFSMGSILPESVITFMTLAFLCICFKTGEFKFFVFAAVLALISSFIKFNAAVGDGLSLAPFTIIIFFRRRSEFIKYLITLCLVPVLWALIFMLFVDNTHSISGLVYYIRGIYEISAGYISAMSAPIPSKMACAYLAAIIVIFILLLSAFSFFTTKHSVIIALIFAPSVIMAYKHGFAVRHYNIFVLLLFIYTSLYVLFMDSELRINLKLEKLLKIFMCVFFCLTFIISATGLNQNPNFDSKEQMNPIKRFFTHPFFLSSLNHPFVNLYKSIISSVQNLNALDKRERHLNPEFQRIISLDSAAIYPHEISLAADISNYKTMPVFQAYSAYTSWLDKENAKFFALDSTAPEFIVFNLEAIDDRFALIECPQTWLEIFKHYRITSKYENVYNIQYVTQEYRTTEFLLKREKANDFIYSEPITQSFSRDSTIILPDTEFYCLMNLELRLNLLGRLAKIFFSIPRLDMEVEFVDGRKITRRVLAEVLKNDTLISQLPADSDSFEKFMSGDLNINRVKSFRLTGPGLKYYNASMSVTFKKFSPGQ